jgi:beta-N-acetylhexosaminidase
VAASAEQRRRRLWALIGVAALAAVLGIIAGASSGGESGEPPPAVSFCGRPATTPTQIAGQGIVARMDDKATPALLALARRGEIGGLVLFPETSNYDALAKQIRMVQQAALAGGNPKLLISIDQEGGIVKRLASIPPQLSPYTLAQNNDPSASRLEGKATGFQLRHLGIGVDLAPVLDVPDSENQFMFVRAFGSSPAQVTRLGLPFAQGLMEKGVAAAAKHFPGLGRATLNTDFAPTTITASRGELIHDMRPFKAAVEAGVPIVMVSSAAYPGLGGKTPASLSPEIVTDTLRGRLGFGGVVVTDDLLTPAVNGKYSPLQAAARATNAGVDLKLYAGNGVNGLARALAKGAKRGQVSTAALVDSCERIVALKDRIAARSPELPAADPAVSPTDASASSSAATDDSGTQ